MAIGFRSASAGALCLMCAFFLGLICSARGAGGRVSSIETVPAADVMLTHGVIHTMNPVDTVVDTLAIASGKIVYAGPLAGATQWRGRRTRSVDLGGRTVLPGLSDAHVHPALGEFLNHRLCNVHALTVAAGLEKLRACAASAPPGDWVVGYGWYDLDNPEFDRVTRLQIDAIVSDRKAAVISRDIHTVWVNSKVLKEFGIRIETTAPAGGAIIRDPVSGEATGMLIDAASHPVVDRIQHDSPYAVPTTELYRLAMQHLNSLGITAILDAFVDAEAASAYHELDLAHQLPMRVSLASPVLPGNYLTEIPHIAALRDSAQSSRVRLNFIKVLADGNPEVGLSSFLTHDGSAQMTTPGYYTAEQLRAVVLQAQGVGLSIFVHVIGDGAVRDTLDAIDLARSGRGTGDFRHTLTHLCWVSDADLPRFKSLGVIANIQEGWLAPSAFGGPPGYDYARSTASGPLGPWLAGRLMPYGPLQAAGARLAAGSDWFYTDENPWITMEAGITSRDPGGANRVAMLPNHALDLRSVLRAHTVDAAFQMFRENEIGSLEPGKQADLIVLDRDPFRIDVEDLHKVRVLQTFVAGDVVYQAQPQ